MTEKTIKQVLVKKISKWIDTIKDENVKDAISKDLIITGGCFPSMIQNEIPKDFDCYFIMCPKLVSLCNVNVSVDYIDKYQKK